MPDIEITDNPAESRWELHADGKLAVFSTYHDTVVSRAGHDGKRRTFVHTETQDGFEGKGLASQLVRAELEDAQARGLEINPVCPFVRGWLDRHPDFVVPRAQSDGVSSGPEEAPGGDHAGDQG